MSYQLDMARCLAYMRQHLDENLPVQQLADNMGYSLYHFCRAFKSISGLTPAAYWRRLRLERACGDLKQGASVTDAALNWGFDTPSGFNRAFRKQFGQSPTAYIKTGGSKIMKPIIKKIDEFNAVGYVFPAPEGDFDVLQNGAYWLGKDFSGVSSEDYQKLTYPGYAEIGTWQHDPADPGELYYCFGPSVKTTDFIPDGMKLLTFPAAEYAVFTAPAGATPKETAANVKKTWQYIFGAWFDASDWQFDETKQDFECYFEDKSYILVPVVKK